MLDAGAGILPRFYSSPARSGYRIQVDPDGNATRAIYYMEKELSNLDPSRPANYSRCECHFRLPWVVINQLLVRDAKS